MHVNTAASPFAGLWDVTHATLPNGEFAYSGQIRIEPQAAIFQLTWDISAGHYVGIGLIHGDHLVVSCGEQYAGLGIIQFTTAAEAPPSIQWASAELGGVLGTGIFTTPWAGTLEGQHQLVQYLPNGQIYGEWTLSIQRIDDIYRLMWSKGESIHFRGIGLATSQGLAAGWYPDMSQIAFLDYRIDADNPNQLQAVWALGSFTTLGTETLIRLIKFDNQHR